MISSSAALLGILSKYAVAGTTGDPSRITAGVVTGIGFIGGGVIMQQGFNIKGITTAAIIWCTSALGVAVGHGLYVPAFFAFTITVVALPFFEVIENKFFPAGKIKTITLVYKENSIDLEKIKAVISDFNFIFREFSFDCSFETHRLTVAILVNAPAKVEPEKLGLALKDTGELLHISYSS